MYSIILDANNYSFIVPLTRVITTLTSLYTPLSNNQTRNINTCSSVDFYSPALGKPLRTFLFPLFGFWSHIILLFVLRSAKRAGSYKPVTGTSPKENLFSRSLCVAEEQINTLPEVY